jgi:hypothetical protein
MLDGEDDDSNSNQDLNMPDNLHGEISGNIWRMMDQQFACPTHASVGKDLGLEDTLSNVLQWLGDIVAFDPDQEVEAPQPHKDVALHDPILWAQMIEVQCKARVAMEILCQPTHHQTPVDLCLEGAQKGTEHVWTMEVGKTNYR